ncbi:hypothetical protein CsatA_024624 [Cannabis sativa]
MNNKSINIFGVILGILLCMNNYSCVNAKYTVYIINFLDVNTTLSVHCKSADDDLGTHIVSYGDNFNWSFNINFFRTTLFYCDMSTSKGDLKGHFVVFDAQKYDCHDNKCYWKVSQSGLYLFNYLHNEYELQYSWPKSLVIASTSDPKF